MDEQEWDIALWDIARKAADERYKLHADGFMPQTIAVGSEEYMKKKFADEFHEQLSSALKYENLDDEDRRVVKNFPISNMTNWLMGVEKDNPLAKSYETKYDKFASLIDDNVNEEFGKDSWYKQDFVNDLEARKKAQELGYNMNKVEDRGEFFKKLAEFQTAYDRGIATDNMGESGWGKFNSYVHPSVWEEAQKQSLTGKGTEQDLKDLALVDALTNAMVFSTPGLPSTHGSSNILARISNFGTRPVENLGYWVSEAIAKKSPKLAKVDDFLSNPVATGFMDAMYQGGIEGSRQLLKQLVDPELEFNTAAPVVASTMGATRPAMYMTATGALNQFSGPTMRNIAKGILKSTRSGNPVTIEENAIRDAIEAYESQLGKTGIDRGISTAEVMKRTKGARARDILKAFEVEDDAGRKVNLLKKYNDDGTWKWDWDNDAMALTPESKARMDKLKAVAGAKLADMGDATPDVKLGLALGNLIGETGSRFEPTFKFNPLKPSKPVSQSDYKDSDWYSRMDPEQRAAIEQAIADLVKRRRKGN